MQIVLFHLMPYAELPDDFQQKHRSVWVDIDPTDAVTDPRLAATDSRTVVWSAYAQPWTRAMCRTRPCRGTEPQSWRDGHRPDLSFKLPNSRRQTLHSKLETSPDSRI